MNGTHDFCFLRPRMCHLQHARRVNDDLNALFVKKKLRDTQTTTIRKI